jgi:hypothetical protein
VNVLGALILGSSSVGAACSVVALWEVYRLQRRVVAASAGTSVGSDPVVAADSDVGRAT